MSITLQNSAVVSRSPLNTSPSKQLFSFSKSSRFANSARSMCDRFYDLKKSPGRTASFGFGNKYDFTKLKPQGPPPNSYDIKSEFNANIKKGFGFGKGREEMETTGPMAQTLTNKNPGPGSYKLPSTLKNSNYRIRSRIVITDKEKLSIPGPGKYQIPFNISQNGTYFLSKHKNSLAPHFSMLNRAQDKQNKVPGPGFYDTSKQDLSPDGKYCLSNMKNSLVRSFGSSDRNRIVPKSKTPGPGSYRIPSQFGHYTSKSSLINSNRASQDKDNTPIN